MLSGTIHSASKGEADIPGVPIAIDEAVAPTFVCCCPILPAFGSEETPDIGFSESGIGDGAKGVEGDGTTKGELVCKGVPGFVRDEIRFGWSTCGEGCCRI